MLNVNIKYYLNVLYLIRYLDIYHGELTLYLNWF